MPHRRAKKRNHAQFTSDSAPDVNLMGVGTALAQLRASNNESQTHHPDQPASDSEEWQVIGKGGKKLKKTYPGFVYSDSYRMQSNIRIADFQNLLLYCLADGPSPQWIGLQHHKMVNKAVVIFVPGLEKGMFDGTIPLEEDLRAKQSVDPNGSDESLTLPNTLDSAYLSTNASPDDYLPQKLDRESLPISLQSLADIFSHIWPVKSPGDDRMGKVHSPLQAMLQAPIPKTYEEKMADKKTKGPKPAREGKSWVSQRTRITEYISSIEDLQDSEYVVHPSCFLTEEERQDYMRHREQRKQTVGDGWVDSQVDGTQQGTLIEDDGQQSSLSAGRNVLAVDCEMCKVEGDVFALTRISLVDWNKEVVLDELVKPEKTIIDYLTPFSGMTAAKLDPVTTTLKDIQQRLLSLLTPNTILVGHSLNSDLSALQMTHPFIVDTSIIYPHPRGPPMKSSLRWLAQKYLSREIQKGHGETGHDSIEDARACLDLVKMKCEKGPAWGTSESNNETIFKRLKRSPLASLTSPSQAFQGKEGAIIDHGSPEKNFGTMASYCIGCESDAEVVEATKRAVLGDSDGSYIPGGGVAFTWARLRGLEHFRGWRNDEQPPNDNNTTTTAQQTPPITSSNTTTLAQALSETVTHILAIQSFLPPCTLLMIYSGTGDPREMARLQALQRTYRREMREGKKYDECSVKWDDRYEEALKKAARKARNGCGLVGIF